MINGTTFKVYTFINCGRRVTLPEKVDYYSRDSLSDVVNSQLRLEKTKKRRKKSLTNRSTLRKYPDVLKLIDEHHGNFLQWRRDLCLSVIIIEVLFDDLNSLYEYGYAVNKLEHISSKYVYSITFDGKSHISTDARDYKYPARMSKIMVEAAEAEEEDFDQQEFYYEISKFLGFIDTMTIHKIKRFKNSNGCLGIDIAFQRYCDFLVFKAEMDRRAAS